MNDFSPIIDPRRLTGGHIVIAGPCSAESREQLTDTAMQLAAGGIRVFRAGLWKPRTKPGTFEGVGAEGLEWMQEVKRLTGMLTATEVATGQHVHEAVAAGIDMLWLGARTTASPFAVQEIADALAETGRGDVAVLVKNPVNPDLDLWIGALERIYNAGVHRLAAVHRGFSSYGASSYRNLPMWQIPFELRRRIKGLPLICDPSHMGGRRSLIGELSQTALDMGYDGLIIESHREPDCALSDAAQQVTPEALLAILGTLNYRTAHVADDNLAILRSQIDALDSELLELLARRMGVSREIGRYKRDRGVAVVQPERFDSIMESRVEAAGKLGMSPEFMRSILSAIHAESVSQQLRESTSGGKHESPLGTVGDKEG